eukprot:CAMPEP_0172181754 /NCGR_PEP_ID=MMETSP1050-20130122/18001_1 /TAXON_ID=233186 /ORGANISM="Cryptomonas curvata, Strain CCAP979/52" /LENGTH=178 /DNA_ID=CAMNT_0012855087 /DNA_START=106 /DNA_END=638 /DNA_ORIENTATION=+
MVKVGSDGDSDVTGGPTARTRALVLDSNIRHCYDLVDPRKTCLLRIIVLILAIHAATSFEVAADGSHSGNDVPPSDPDQPEPGELILTNLAAFRYALAEYNETGMLIEFFLPWCGHSRRLRPELSQAAREMAGRRLLFARVDCSSPDGSAICQEHEIAYHPSMVLFLRGRAFDYQLRG